LKGWSPEKMLPLALATDEEKPEGRHFQFIGEKILFNRHENNMCGSSSNIN
jgi:hypothetical protein